LGAGWVDPAVPEFFNPTAYLLDRHVETPTADRTALVADGTRVSYRDLLGRVCRTAGALAALGLEPEDRLLLFGTDSVEWMATWLACLRAGVVPAAVSDLYKADMLLYFLVDTAAKALFIDAEQLPKLDAVRDRLPATLRHVIVRGALGEDAFPDRFEPVPRHRNDVAYMLYSGGTTGRAKGITHLPLDFLLIPERHGRLWEYGPADVCLATSKKYFTHGLWPGVLIPLYWGATAVMTRAAPTPEHLAGLVEAERPTVLVTVPTVVKNLLAWADETGRQPDFASVRLAVTASEKMPLEVFERFHRRFPHLELLDSIGSSEVTYEWIANRPGEFRRGSVGKPVPGCEVRLVDADGRDVLEPGRPGEAWVRSETACLFYWRKLRETKETFVGPWVRTGDTLYFDEDGFYWFAGRSDDLFKVRGLWVSPVEVEAAVAEHPAVFEAAVVPVEDADGLTQVGAYVVLRPGCEPGEAVAEEIRARVRQKLGGYRAPARVEFVAALPRTTLAKIDRRALRGG
jgi:benzoate-CoA ligase family protein